jgi:hypothetical protein
MRPCRCVPSASRKTPSIEAWALPDAFFTSGRTRIEEHDDGIFVALLRQVMQRTLRLGIRRGGEWGRRGKRCSRTPGHCHKLPPQAGLMHSPGRLHIIYPALRALLL